MYDVPLTIVMAVFKTNETNKYYTVSLGVIKDVAGYCMANTLDYH